MSVLIKLRTIKNKAETQNVTSHAIDNNVKRFAIFDEVKLAKN